MKRSSLIFILIFFGNIVTFAQTHPTEVFRKFWSMALSNNFESAKLFVVEVTPSEFKDKQIRDSFQIISENQLKFPDLENTQIFTDSAYYVFQIESENKKRFKGQVLLLNRDRHWKVLLFDVRPATETKILRPFRPLPRDFPIQKNCPKCG